MDIWIGGSLYELEYFKWFQELFPLSATGAEHIEYSEQRGRHYAAWFTEQTGSEVLKRYKMDINEIKIEGDQEALLFLLTNADKLKPKGWD